MVHGKKKGMKKKYQAGEATQYISRKHARKRLQVIKNKPWLYIKFWPTHKCLKITCKVWALVYTFYEI